MILFHTVHTIIVSVVVINCQLKPCPYGVKAAISGVEAKKSGEHLIVLAVLAKVCLAPEASHALYSSHLLQKIITIKREPLFGVHLMSAWW
jgi:hypothetical protein